MTRLPHSPLLPVAIAFIGGVVAHDAGASGGCILTLVAAAVALWLAASRVHAALLLLTCACGTACAWIASKPMPHWAMDGDTHSWSGTVEEWRVCDGAQMALLDIDSCDGHRCPHLKVQCMVATLLPDCGEGYRVAFRSNLSPLASYNDLPGQPSADLPLHRRGVHCRVWLGPHDIDTVSPAHGLSHWLHRQRRCVQQAIGSSPMASGTKSFAIAVLTGDRHLLTPADTELYTGTGLAHILALSGLHVGIITAIIALLLLPLRLLPRGREMGWILTGVSLWAFAVMTGLSPSVTRAVTVATLYVGCLLLQRVWNPLNSLAATALAIAALWPWKVFTMGFVLSFAAATSILVLAPALNPWHGRPCWQRTAAAAVLVPVTAMLATAVVCAWQFNYFPYSFLPANIVASIILPPLIASSALAATLSALGLPAGWLGTVADALHSILTQWTKWITDLTGGAVHDLWLPGWAPWMWAAVLVALSCALYTRRRAWMWAVGMLVAAGILWMFTTATPKVGAPALTLLRQAPCPTALVCLDGKPWLFTTAPGPQRDAVMRWADGYTRRFRLEHSMGQLKWLPLSHSPLSGHMLNLHGRSLLFIDHDSIASLASGTHPHAAILCRGYKGDAVATARQVGARAVYLDAKLHPRRSSRYVNELQQAGIPCHDLRSHPLSVGL